MRKLIIGFAMTGVVLLVALPVFSQIVERERPAEWSNLVVGARFMDRFLPMKGNVLSSDTWGAQAVVPRYTDNGIEDRVWSYWGGNIVEGSDGLYHMMVCGWLENSPKGHFEWPNSLVFNAVSKSPTGPFTPRNIIGRGHNPEVYRLDDGRYVLYCIDKRFISDDLNGVWEESTFDFNPRDRRIIEGLTNLSFARREDSSYIMVCRGGGIWISRDGLSEYGQLTDKRVYPDVDGRFEDPVIWRDHIQYHMIVNDWLGRIAYYLRSKDGVTWVVDPGEAYMPGIAVHEDGMVEDWFKFERVKMYQDKYGRAIQANFAVIDTLKAEDKPYDNYSSKNIVIPLNPGLLLTLPDESPVTSRTKTIRVKIQAEPGFDPRADVDIQSLRFGASTEVNFGRGCKALSSRQEGDDLIVTFDAAGHGITTEEFAPKMIGKYSDGKMLYGYARLPYMNYNEPLLSARSPILAATEKGMEGIVEIQNFGQVASEKTSVRVGYSHDGKTVDLVSGTIPPLQPYEKAEVRLAGRTKLKPDGKYDILVTIYSKQKTLSTFNTTVGPFVAQNNMKEHVLDSPDKKQKLTIKQSATGNFTYRFSAYGTDVIDTSLLGYRMENGATIPSAGWNIEHIARNSVDDLWTPLWGKRTRVPDKYNELILRLSSANNPSEKLEIIARAYNDGVAFRYAVPNGSRENQRPFLEQTEYNFASDYTAWSYNGERHNVGPELLTSSEGKRFPVMTVKVDDGLFLALHEACLDSGEPLALTSKKGEKNFKIDAAPSSIQPGYISPWRVIFCGTAPGKLVDSHLLELLSPDPNPGSDFSWVKPGIALWDWRINGAKWDGYTYDMSFGSWVRMIDFASEQGFRYLVLDANWYGPEFSDKSDPIKGDKANDVKKIIQYGKEKNVGVWLYLNDVGGRNYPLEETLKQYGAWGAAGVKYGFMRGNMIEKNIRTRRITEICAQNKLLINFHDGPVHPYGQMRTLPNAVTREYCQAQLDGHQIFYPKTFVTSVFVNMLAGPLDMNNGMFDLRQGKTTRIDNNQEVPSTVVSEAARTLITFSGVTIIPDIPEYYHKYPELLGFLSAQKMPWRESETLSGEIGEYIVMMRQADDGTFLVGAATNESERTLDIPLHFLGKGNYEAQIIEDGEDAHYLRDREKYKVSGKDVTRESKLRVRLAPGGGACIIFKQKKPK